MMNVSVKVSCRASTDSWPGNAQHLAWLWVSKAAVSVWAGPSGHRHLGLVTFLGNVFHLDSLGWCHHTSESVPSLRVPPVFQAAKLQA